MFVFEDYTAPESTAKPCKFCGVLTRGNFGPYYCCSREPCLDAEVKHSNDLLAARILARGSEGSDD